LYWIAKAEEERHNFDQALSILKEIALNFPENMSDPYQIRKQAWEDFAYILHHTQKRYQEALGVYQNILIHFPENERKLAIMNEMANCYEKLGKKEKALAIYKKMLHQATDSFHRKLAALKIKYLSSEPVWSKKSLSLLYKEIKSALLSRNVQKLEKLARKGDFWVGQIFSEFEVTEFESLKPYLEEKLQVAENIEVGEPVPTDGFYAVQIINWPDSEYNILYLLIVQENYGWEWKGIILSNQELEKGVSQPWSDISLYF
ncbi:MAG: tetratricopeptide repeat protein, partial [Candidatus Atribacteria bacterium]|nr:tetratricopeptide repeat protein [Candidatus Atribacteria bacterium]MCD6349468.1 tetratricopeptide repeat protein [Candidatus Atribacteria bacterium]